MTNLPSGLIRDAATLTALLVTVFTLSGYMAWTPTALRRGRVRRARLKTQIKRRALTDARLDARSLTMPLTAFGAEYTGNPADDPAHGATRNALASAYRQWGLRLDAGGERVALDLTTLPAGRRALGRALDGLAAPLRWLAGSDDPRAAWYTALILGEGSAPRVIGEAARQLVDHAPGDPLTARVTAEALRHPTPTFALAVAAALGHRPTLDAFSAPAIVDTLDPADIHTLVSARVAADLDGGAGLQGHTHPAIRFVWLFEHADPDEATLAESAGDPCRMIRALAWSRAVRTDRDTLAVARRVVMAGDAAGADDLVARLATDPGYAGYDPFPDALAHLGRHGEVDDVRLVAPLMQHPEVGRIARRARAQLRSRLGDRLQGGHLSLPGHAAGGELSPAIGGELSNPADAPEDDSE